MREVVTRLVERRDRVPDRRRALSQPLDLREHEPDPVAPLRARAELGHCGVDLGRLGRDEALQIAQDVASECCTTSNSSSDHPDATGRARSPECASIAGPFSHAWKDSSSAQWVTTK